MLGGPCEVITSSGQATHSGGRVPLAIPTHMPLTATQQEQEAKMAAYHTLGEKSHLLQKPSIDKA